MQMYVNRGVPGCVQSPLGRPVSQKELHSASAGARLKQVSFFFFFFLLHWQERKPRAGKMMEAESLVKVNFLMRRSDGRKGDSGGTVRDLT